MTRPTDFEPLLVTSRQAAAMLSVSERTLWSITASGRLPRIQLRRAVRYSVDDLRSYISAARIQADAPEVIDARA